MADRKITELPPAEATDIENADSLFHLVNPDRVQDSDKNRKLTVEQLNQLIEEAQLHPLLLIGA